VDAATFAIIDDQGAGGANWNLAGQLTDDRMIHGSGSFP